MRKLTKKGSIDVQTFMLLCFILILISCIIMIFVVSGSKNHWNNGRCPKCNTEWRYVQAVGHQYTTGYIYVCDTCGDKIETNHEPDWKTVKTGELNENN